MAISAPDQSVAYVAEPEVTNLIGSLGVSAAQFQTDAERLADGVGQALTRTNVDAQRAEDAVPLAQAAAADAEAKRALAEQQRQQAEIAKQAAASSEAASAGYASALALENTAFVDVPLSSIAALEASAGVENALRTVKGGRGGRFEFRPANASLTADGVLAFAASGGGYWVRLLTPDQPITPEMAGAVGDGVADDGSALAAALSVAVAAKRSLVLTATYGITSTVSVPPGTAIVQRDGSSVKANSNMSAMLSVSGALRAAGLSLDGNAKANRGLVLGSGSIGVDLDSPSITGIQQYAGDLNSTCGMRITDGTGRITIRNPYISGVEGGARKWQVGKGYPYL